MFVENIIYFVLGALVSALLGLFIMPSFWKRAVRLTKKRYESANPLTMAEFRADKDQLRAQFALSTRKLEMQIEKLRKNLSEQLVELNEHKSELALSDIEQDKQVIITKELETRLAFSREKIIEHEKNIADISQRLRMRERELESRDDNSRDKTLELEKKTIGLSHKLRMKEREIEQLKSLNKNSNNRPSLKKSLSKPSPKKAEAQIAKANNKLNDLVFENKDSSSASSDNNRSLAQDLNYEEKVEHLHENIVKIEKEIISKWQKNNVPKKADLTSLRNELEEIATMTTSLVYTNDSDNQLNLKETLFEKVKKFASDKTDNIDVKQENNLTKATKRTTQ